MRNHALVTAVASGALIVATSGVVAAFLVDDESAASTSPVATPTSLTTLPSAIATPTASVRPSVRPSATSAVTSAPAPSPTPTTRPTRTPTPAPTPGSSAARPTTSATPTTAPAPATSAPSPRPRKRPIYTVKPGDTLSEIAAWFGLHGYDGLYERNRQVIGDDPDLIHPGQRFTISSTGMLLLLLATGS